MRAFASIIIAGVLSAALLLGWAAGRFIREGRLPSDSTGVHAPSARAPNIPESEWRDIPISAEPLSPSLLRMKLDQFKQEAERWGRLLRANTRLEDRRRRDKISAADYLNERGRLLAEVLTQLDSNP